MNFRLKNCSELLRFRSVFFFFIRRTPFSFFYGNFFFLRRRRRRRTLSFFYFILIRSEVQQCNNSLSGSINSLCEPKRSPKKQKARRVGVGLKIRKRIQSRKRINSRNRINTENRSLKKKTSSIDKFPAYRQA